MSEQPKKPSWFDRVMNKVPVFGKVRRTKGWMRRNRGWVYLAVAAIVLIVFRPVFTVLAELFKIVSPFIRGLLDNPVGRFIVGNVVAIIVLWWIWRRVRGGVQRVLGLKTMRHFLDGMQAMMLNRWRPAIAHFERVVWWSRWVNLEDAVPEHRDIVADAYLKVATCYQRLGDANNALNWLKRVPQDKITSDHVRRNYAELHALAYDLSDELEEETVLKELEKTDQASRGNRRVLRALRERLEGAGDLDQARVVGKKLVAASDGRAKDEAERDLALLEFRLAHQALGDGDKKRMRKALKATAGDTRSALMLGDLEIEQGNVKGALTAWSKAVSMPVFDRLATLLREGRLSGEKEKELLLKFFPYAGTFMVLAEHHLEAGAFRKARAALDQVLASAGENMRVLRLYAACLEGDGEHDAAAQLYRRALSMSFT